MLWLSNFINVKFYAVKKSLRIIHTNIVYIQINIFTKYSYTCQILTTNTIVLKKKILNTEFLNFRKLFRILNIATFV